VVAVYCVVTQLFSGYYVCEIDSNKLSYVIYVAFWKKRLKLFFAIVKHSFYCLSLKTYVNYVTWSLYIDLHYV